MNMSEISKNKRIESWSIGTPCAFGIGIRRLIAGWNKNNKVELEMSVFFLSLLLEEDLYERPEYSGSNIDALYIGNMRQDILSLKLDYIDEKLKKVLIRMSKGDFITIKNFKIACSMIENKVKYIAQKIKSEEKR